MSDINYERLPESLRGGAKIWIEEGVRPGHFLTAVIENDLAGAVGRADDKNILLLLDIVRFWWNDAPAPCWGSVEKAQVWAKMHADRRTGAEMKKETTKGDKK